MEVLITAQPHSYNHLNRTFYGMFSSKQFYLDRISDCALGKEASRGIIKMNSGYFLCLMRVRVVIDDVNLNDFHLIIMAMSFH